MTEMSIPYVQSSYIESKIVPIADQVFRDGKIVDSRYGACQEILGGRFECSSGTLVTREGFNISLGWMEMLQLIAGVYNIEAIKRVAPKADHKLFTRKMAYGPRVYLDIRKILRALAEDPDTRQAVLFVAHPVDGPTSDLPCTLTIQFLIRGGTVHSIVSMRSWDLCRGLPYDLMMFSGLLEVVSRCINIPAGQIIVTAGSAHIYLDQLTKVPYLDSRRWRFTNNAPRDWNHFVSWSEENIVTLKRGGVPEFVEYVSI
jgi:thymidylate synthase